MEDEQIAYDCCETIDGAIKTIALAMRQRQSPHRAQISIDAFKRLEKAVKPLGIALNSMVKQEN